MHGAGEAYWDLSVDIDEDGLVPLKKCKLALEIRTVNRMHTGHIILLANNCELETGGHGYGCWLPMFNDTFVNTSYVNEDGTVDMVITVKDVEVLQQ